MVVDMLISMKADNGVQYCDLHMCNVVLCYRFLPYRSGGCGEGVQLVAQRLICT